MFLNLAQNAIQAMPKGGRLTINCAPMPNRRVRVRVEDTGVGIAPENLAKIFDLYYTTKERGTGIGLSLVYRTIQIHNGEIDVESTVGVGTSFIVELPASASDGPGPAEACRRIVGRRRITIAMMRQAPWFALVLLTASLGACAAKAQVRTEAEMPLLDPPPPPPRVVAIYAPEPEPLPITPAVEPATPVRPPARPRGLSRSRRRSTTSPEPVEAARQAAVGPVTDA